LICLFDLRENLKKELVDEKSKRIILEDRLKKEQNKYSVVEKMLSDVMNSRKKEREVEAELNKRRSEVFF
jgi:hypothetical protein